jgi:hypothetical protein
MTAECREVIITYMETRGNGTELSPIRRITQVFEKDGTLIAEKDPIDETFTLLDIIHFATWCMKQKIAPESIKPKDVENWIQSIKVNN